MRSIPVATLCMVTVALTTAAPLASVTVPRIDPRNVCAEAGVAASIVSGKVHTTAMATPHLQKLFMVFSCGDLYDATGRDVPSKPRITAIVFPDKRPAPTPTLKNPGIAISRERTPSQARVAQWAAVPSCGKRD